MTEKQNILKRLRAAVMLLLLLNTSHHLRFATKIVKFQIKNISGNIVQAVFFKLGTRNVITKETK